MDTFPYDSWEEAMAAAAELDEAYFTFGESGAVPLVILGFIAMCIALVKWVVRERTHLDAAAAELQGSIVEELRG